MAYSGKYIVKHKSKYQGDSNNVVYRSLWERNAFKWCDDNPSIQHWSSEEIVIPYKYDIDKRVHRYFMDLKIKYKNGKTFLIEIIQKLLHTMIKKLKMLYMIHPF